MTKLIERLLSEVDGPEFAVRAPGRANLIGEHTDYNDGFVLPVALELATYLVGRRTEDRVRIRSLDEEGEVEVDLTSGAGPTRGWGRYVTAVVRALRDENVDLLGFSGVLASEVPAGSGLSSSAALEVSLGLALSAEPLEPLRLARICRRAENHYVGVQSGIMDQLASAAGRCDCALLIDCLDGEVSPVRLPKGLSIVVIDSGVRRGLGDSAYNQRLSECRQAAEILGVDSLRDANQQQIEKSRASLPEHLYRRARHVVSENRRVLETVDALSAGDRDAVGSLFAASHQSLASDYEVSIRELDALVECALGAPGVVGSRLTGAGFGGCTVTLVEDEAAEDALAAIASNYRDRIGIEPRGWISGAADGAGPLGL